MDNILLHYLNNLFIFLLYKHFYTLYSLDFFFFANFCTLLIMTFLVAHFFFFSFLELESIPSLKENQSCIAHFSQQVPFSWYLAKDTRNRALGYALRFKKIHWMDKIACHLTKKKKTYDAFYTFTLHQFGLFVCLLLLLILY